MMKKYDLLRSGDNIIRVLEVRGDWVLVTDYIKRTMPVWVGMDDLDTGQRKAMYRRYTMIAPILPFVADDKMCSRLICSVAEEHNVSKQTVRSYLCLYLAYMDVATLAPKRREGDRQLTQDEKNIRWALNKFFYTTWAEELGTIAPLWVTGHKSLLLLSARGCWMLLCAISALSTTRAVWWVDLS